MKWSYCKNSGTSVELFKAIAPLQQGQVATSSVAQNLFFFFKRTYSTVKGFPCLTSQFKSSKAEKPLFQSIRSDGPKVQYEIWTLMFVLCHSNYLFMWQHLIEREEHFKGSHAPAAFQAHKQTVFNNG